MTAEQLNRELIQALLVDAQKTALDEGWVAMVIVGATDPNTLHVVSTHSKEVSQDCLLGGLKLVLDGHLHLTDDDS